VAGAALLVNGNIPVALSKSEGAGSVRTVVRLPGAHLYEQVLGNASTKRSRAGPPTYYSAMRRRWSGRVGSGRDGLDRDDWAQGIGSPHPAEARGWW